MAPSARALAILCAVLIAVAAHARAEEHPDVEQAFGDFKETVMSERDAEDDENGKYLLDEFLQTGDGSKDQEVEALPIKTDEQLINDLQLSAEVEATAQTGAAGDSQQAYTVDPGVRVEVGSLWPSASVKGWALLNGRGYRTFKQRVNFSKAFLKAPIVMVSLRSFNILPGHNSRLNCYSESVTSSGFTVVIQTWAASRVYSAGVTWAAYGQDPQMYQKRLKEQRQVLSLDREIRVRQAAHERLRKSVITLRSEEQRAYQTVRSQIARMWKMRNALQAELKRVAAYEKSEFGKIRSELARMKGLRQQLQAELDSIKGKEKQELGAIRSELDIMKKLREHLKDEVKKLRLWERKRFSAIGYEMNELWQDQKNMQEQLAVLKKAEGEMRGEMDNLQPLAEGNSGVVCHCGGGGTGAMMAADLETGASTTANANMGEYFSGQTGVDAGATPTNGDATSGAAAPGKMCVCSGDIKDLELLTFSV